MTWCKIRALLWPAVTVGRRGGQGLQQVLHVLVQLQCFFPCVTAFTRYLIAMQACWTPHAQGRPRSSSKTAAMSSRPGDIKECSTVAARDRLTIGEPTHHTRILGDIFPNPVAVVDGDAGSAVCVRSGRCGGRRRQGGSCGGRNCARQQLRDRR